jgi:hypothetical protein
MQLLWAKWDLELLDRCGRIGGDILGKAVSRQHRRGSTRIFCNLNALDSALWVEGRAQAHNVEVVIGDLSPTRNPLKLHAARKVLSPTSQHSCHHVQVVHAFKAGAHPICALRGSRFKQSRSADCSVG